MKTAEEFILNSESDVHTSNDDISPPQSGSDNEEDDRTETGCTEWTDSTILTFCTYDTQVYRSSQWVKTK
jgi:hypothetical protein